MAIQHDRRGIGRSVQDIQKSIVGRFVSRLMHERSALDFSRSCDLE
jgi:hypothetical protein